MLSTSVSQVKPSVCLRQVSIWEVWVYETDSLLVFHASERTLRKWLYTARTQPKVCASICCCALVGYIRYLYPLHCFIHLLYGYCTTQTIYWCPSYIPMPKARGFTTGFNKGLCPDKQNRCIKQRYQDFHGLLSVFFSFRF